MGAQEHARCAKLSTESPKVNAGKSTIRSFRLSNNLVSRLEKQAGKDQRTFSSLVSSILEEYVEWGAPAKEFGFVPVPNRIYRKLIDSADDETLKDLGVNILPSLWKDMTEFWLQDSSGTQVLELMIFRSKYIPYMHTQVKREGSSETIVVNHTLGTKWNVVLEHALEKLITESFSNKPKIIVGENQVTAHFVSKPKDAHI